PEPHAAPPLDVGDSRLPRLVLPEHELVVAKKVGLRHRVTGGAELTGLVVNEGDDFPEPARHAHAEAHRVVVLEEWAREDGNPHAIGAGVTQRVILEAEP